MDAEVVARDAASIDPELLQLPEVSPLALKENPHIAEQLYSQWLSMPETLRLVYFLFFKKNFRFLLIQSLDIHSFIWII